MSATTLDLAPLASTFAGRLITAGSDDYDEARHVWNGMIDRRPAVIARCTTESDVVAAIRYARESGLEVAVRGGGHNAAGLATCDGGLVVDLSDMRAVSVDANARVAVVQGGATWGDVDSATQAHGLAVTGGAVSTTGVAGLTLGAGIGWLMRSHGLAIDNLLSVRLVLASGEVVEASDRENAELFWALRGGGGNFGVVTEFRFQLHPVTNIRGGLLIHPAERAAEMLSFYADATRDLPDDVTVFAALLTTPDGMRVAGLAPFSPAPGGPADGHFDRIAAFGPPIVDQTGVMPYPAIQSALDPMFPAGPSVYWRSHFLSALPAEAIAAIVSHFERVPSPLTVVLIEQLGGAVSRVSSDATAFDHREARYNVAIIGRWVDPSEAEACRTWTRSLWDALRPFAAGVYVNYLGAGEDETRVRDAYSPDKYARLQAVKRQFDPHNFFHLNQNIKP